MALAGTDTAARTVRVLDEIEKAVIGKRSALELILVGVLAGGHVLLEDLPGLGKTLIARSFAAAFGLKFTRIQFTPDLLPADVTGATVYDQKREEFTFHQGPVFTNLLLADEINRTPPKTQSALLEAMGERQVTVDGRTHQLPDPYVVLATDNPIEYEGTYPLPEAQLDRFCMRISLGYLPEDQEIQMLRRRLDRGTPEATVSTVLSREELLEMRRAVETVSVHEDVLAYVVKLVNASREHPQVLVGASPRGALDLVQLSRAQALVSGRDFVTPDDVKTLVRPALSHRISLRPEMWVRRISSADVLAELVDRVPAPRMKSLA
ncbi:AAA family ATPase [Fodinicola feengrottensis]|uniref:MoxR family ATPase n=1 Tax=Fodinicola feengrottensis TaxID=435914 RepID=A0ABN2HA86_9ACTN|nr:MoxR family ATPase [Fodinicola feengrottensis]